LQTPNKMALIHQDALNRFGIKNTDINGPVQLGTMFAQATISKEGVRQSTANSYLDPNPYPHNLHIISRAFVTRILFNGNTAVGVEYVKSGHSCVAKASKEVIVSTGT